MPWRTPLTGPFGRSHQVPSGGNGLALDRLMCLTKYCRALQSTTKYWKGPPNNTKYFQVLQITTGYYELLGNIRKYYKMLQIVYYTLPIYYVLPTTHYLLFTTNNQVLKVHYLAPLSVNQLVDFSSEGRVILLVSSWRKQFTIYHWPFTMTFFLYV